jgi:OPT family oligopeptide transporter
VVLTFDEYLWSRRAYRGDDVPQLTFRSVALGTVLGFFLSFTNVYIGLKTGWFLGVALTACILSYAIWTFMRKVGVAKSEMTILENNCMQSTASSAGYATGNTVVSAIPALLLLSVTEDNPGGVQMRWPVLAVWVLALASLGVVLAIPLKRNMINREKLTFPSGTAAAVTLQGLYGKGSEALAKARTLFLTGGIAALVPLLKDLEIKKVVDEKTGKVAREALLPGQSNVFDWIPAVPDSMHDRFPLLHHFFHARLAAKMDIPQTWKLSDYQIKLDHGLALVFAGMIVGLRISAWMVGGALILAFFITPNALEAGWTNAAGKLVGAATKPGSAWKEIGIWCGAPLLVSAGLVSFALQWRTIARAFSGLIGKGDKGTVIERELPDGTKVQVSPEDVEVPGRWFLFGAIGAGAGVVIVAWRAFNVPLHLGVLAVLMTFVLGLVACRATGESDITPGGAMGKIMQLTYGVLIPQNATANLMTAGITSGSALAAADLLNDLKSGYLLGANPRRQFIAQAMGIVTGTIATTLGYFLLVPDARVLTGVDGKDPVFPAPGAQQWKAVAEVFKYGLHNLHPMSQTALKVGLVVGAILALGEGLAPKRFRNWIPSPTGLGLGMILPFFYPFAFLLGALFKTVCDRLNKDWATKYVTPIAAGGIAGESIVGVIVQGLNNFVLN